MKLFKNVGILVLVFITGFSLLAQAGSDVVKDFTTISGTPALYTNPAAVNTTDDVFTMEFGLNGDLWNNLLMNDYIEEARKDVLLSKINSSGWVIRNDHRLGGNLIIGPVATFVNMKADGLVKFSPDIAELVLKGNEIGKEYKLDGSLGNGGVYADAGLNISLKAPGGLASALSVEDNYTENLWEMYGSTRKVTPQILVETAMRAKQGKPIARPFGAPRHFSPWHKLMFNPVHLYRMPIPDKEQIDTSVVLGPGAKKPLHLEIPVIISGMSYGGALSKKAKIALARGASMMGTATNTGEAPLLEEEREAAAYLIGQYNRGGWMTEDMLAQLDMVEIQLGQGAQAAAPMKTRSKVIGEEFREAFHLKEGEDALIDSRLPGVNNQDEFKKLVEKLKSIVDVPVGIKLAATHHLEKELEIAVSTDIDFISIDGAEGGTHGGPTILQDDFGLPAMNALSRTVTFLENKGLKEKISIIASGGLLTPGHFLKALALGADAIYIGTIAVMAMIGSQIKKTVPWEPPTDLVLYSGKEKDELDVDQASIDLAYYLKSCIKEMELAAKALGRKSLSEINKSDLSALSEEVSRITGVELVYM